MQKPNRRRRRRRPSGSSDKPTRKLPKYPNEKWDSEYRKVARRLRGRWDNRILNDIIWECDSAAENLREREEKTRAAVYSFLYHIAELYLFALGEHKEGEVREVLRVHVQTRDDTHILPALIRAIAKRTKLNKVSHDQASRYGMAIRQALDEGVKPKGFVKFFSKKGNGIEQNVYKFRERKRQQESQIENHTGKRDDQNSGKPKESVASNHEDAGHAADVEPKLNASAKSGTRVDGVRTRVEKEVRRKFRGLHRRTKFSIEARKSRDGALVLRRIAAE